MKHLCVFLFCLTLLGCLAENPKQYLESVSCDIERIDGLNQCIFEMPSEDNEPVRVWMAWPQRGEVTDKPYLVFSHGAFASPDRYEELLEPFVKAGYIIAAPWHIDSEDVIKQTPLTPAENWRKRRNDVHLLLDSTEILESILSVDGIGIDLNSIGIFGHSYGAFTAQVFAGAKAIDYSDGLEKTELNQRVKAVLAYSPPGVIDSFIDEDAWDGMKVPSMSITGTADVLPGFIDDWQDHLIGYRNAPEGNNWAFVGKNVDHYFGKRIGRLGSPDESQGEAFQASLEAGIAFMNFYILGDPAAFEYLQNLEENAQAVPVFQLYRR